MIRATLCASCPGSDNELAEALQTAFAATGLDVAFARTECMSGCARPVTLAFRASNKTAYLFGGIGLSDLPDILTFLRLYNASDDGSISDARPLGALRLKALARIPG